MYTEHAPLPYIQYTTQRCCREVVVKRLPSQQPFRPLPTTAAVVLAACTTIEQTQPLSVCSHTHTPTIESKDYERQRAIRSMSTRTRTVNRLPAYRHASGGFLAEPSLEWNNFAFHQNHTSINPHSESIQRRMYQFIISTFFAASASRCRQSL